MPWIFQCHSNSKANFTKTLNESSWSELAHYLTCSKFKLKTRPNSLRSQSQILNFCRWIGNFFINILLSLNSVGVTLPTLILFVKDGDWATARLARVGSNENVCKLETRYLTELKTTKELRRERPEPLGSAAWSPCDDTVSTPQSTVTLRIHFTLCLIRRLAVASSRSTL